MSERPVPSQPDMGPQSGRLADSSANFLTGPRVDLGIVNDLVSRKIVHANRHPNAPLTVLDYDSWSQKKRAELIKKQS